MRGQQRGSIPQPTQIGIIHYTCSIPGVCVSKQTSASWLICSVFPKSGRATHLWCLKEPTEPPHIHTSASLCHRTNVLMMRSTICTVSPHSHAGFNSGKRILKWRAHQLGRVICAQNGQLQKTTFNIQSPNARLSIRVWPHLRFQSGWRILNVITP